MNLRSIRTEWLLAGVAFAVLALVTGCAAPDAAASKPAASRRYSFWPLAPDEPRIQYLRSFRSSRDVTQRRSSNFETMVFGKENEQAAAIDKPYGVAMHNGRIYVCDIRSRNVTVLDLGQRQVRLMGVTGANALAHPVDVAVAEDGEVYVADNERDAIVVFDAHERYSRTLGRSGLKPVSLAVHGDRLYVCDIKGQKVEVFNRRSGAAIASIGTVGDSDGQFRLPLGVETDDEGNVYVVDMMRCRVQKLTPEGAYIAGVGAMGDSAGSFARPKHMAVDADGIMYVIDAAFQNVQMFNDKQELLMHFGAAGNFPGSMNLPAGICVSETGIDLFKDDLHPGFEAKRLIVVTNQFGPDLVSVYAMGTRRDGYSVADLAAAAAPVETGVGRNPAMSDLQAVEEGDEPPSTEPVPVPAPQPPAPKP